MTAGNIGKNSVRGSLRVRIIRASVVAGLGVVSIGLGGTLGGCGSDLITYAGESRQQGIQLYNAGSYADAAGAFTNAIKQDPRDYRAHYYLGRSYESLGQYHQSVQAYRTALDVMANSLAGREDTAFRAKVLDGLATAAARGNSRALEQAALKNRTQPTAEDELVRAKIFRLHGDGDSAVEAYGRATLTDPNNFAMAKEFGLYLAQTGQREPAARQLSRAYALNRKANRPEDVEVVAGLRQVGVVPGPSLADETDLAQPPIPVGPLPAAEDLAKLRLQPPVTSEQAPGATAGAPTPQE